MFCNISGISQFEMTLNSPVKLVSTIFQSCPAISQTDQEGEENGKEMQKERVEWIRKRPSSLNLHQLRQEPYYQKLILKMPILNKFQQEFLDV